jgi:hypothetical protein
MALNISNAEITATGSKLAFKNTSQQEYFSRNVSSNYAIYENLNVPAFISGCPSNPGWITPVASGAWGKINNYCTNTVYNRGSHYNTSTTRFTAPITGPYWFAFSTYLVTTSYVHPLFTKNGSITSGYATPQYRMRGHGMASGYAEDAQIEEVMYLTANDFVEVYWYASGTCQSYVHYSIFQGAYVG